MTKPQMFQSRQIPVLARIEVQRISHRYANAEKSNGELSLASSSRRG